MLRASLRLAAPSLLLSLSCFTVGCGSAPGEGGVGTSAEDLSLSTNARPAFQYFVGKGLTPTQAAGIVGNLEQESNIDPTIAQYGGGPGRGIAQWSTGGRWDTDHDDNVAWYAQTHGGSEWSLTTQLDFIWYELETFSSYGLSSLKSSTSVTSATVAFQSKFEGCGTCDESTRIAYAQAALSAYGSGSGSSGGGSGSSSGSGSGSGSGGGSGSSSGGTTGGCYSNTLGKEMPSNACVQSRSDDSWYQCDNGSWVDRWTDPTACSGVYPL